MIADVALPLPVDQSYSYEVPDSLAGTIAPGMRVRVPFGPRQLVGVVVSLSNDAPADPRIKQLDALLDDRPALTDELLRLTKWISEYYVCSWGEAIRAALPPGGDVQARVELHLRLQELYRSAEAMDEVVSSLRGEKQKAVVELLGKTPAGQWLRQADVLARTQASASTVSALEKKGVVERAEREVLRDSLRTTEVPPIVDRTLHPAQTAALKEIEGSLDSGTYAAFLLHGVTGSGKTEVYIEALKSALRSGRSGIVLVPEIALTPQTVGRFRAHFGDEVAVLHSRMSTGERFDAWRQLRDGAFRIAIGPRSAVLAPISNLGLIIVDEEHETSYKQADPAPRYHARDVAVMRAHLNDAVCVLGSATPSLESWINARESRKYRLLEMPNRVPIKGHPAAPLPEVRIVDLVLERRRHQLDGVFSKPLLQAIERRLERQEQVILLQNRRGFAPVIECLQCGWVPECPDCSVSFTYHKARHHLKCHYCGRARKAPARCESCGSDDLGQHGAGTQRVEEELQSRLPAARVLRMDLDTTSQKQSHHRILSRFRRGEADVLLGTQMVAKGLDFPRVTLVGVVNADTGLLLPDFRADEHTFQLLTQVAGRAGRADLKGEVILQTRNADNPVVRLAAAHDYHAFAELALPERREIPWPPYCRLVVVEFNGPDEPRVRELAGEWTTQLRAISTGLFILDPVPATISRVKRRHRYRTIVRAERSRSAELQQYLKQLLDSMPRPRSGYRVKIDVDAVDTL